LYLNGEIDFNIYFSTAFSEEKLGRGNQFLLLLGLK
jgi:hypothetical protein